MFAQEGWESLSLQALGTTWGAAKPRPSCVILGELVSLSELHPCHLQVTRILSLTSKDSYHTAA